MNIIELDRPKNYQVAYFMCEQINQSPCRTMSFYFRF